VWRNQITSRKGALTPLIKRAYILYFACKVGDQDKSWAVHMSCTSCSSKLKTWMNRKGFSLPIAVPMIWRELTNYLTDSYFCMAHPIQKGIIKKKKWIVENPNIPSTIHQVQHYDGLPVPEPSKSFSLESGEYI
jgi:hypothetical protein